jgi:hypothetical protein
MEGLEVLEVEGNFGYIYLWETDGQLSEYGRMRLIKKR